MSEKTKLSKNAVEAHGKVLDRLEKSLADAEVSTWEGLKDEIENAVEFEQGVARLTREEWDLIKAYIKRDLEGLSRFVAETGSGLKEWLRMDMDLLEQKLRRTLLSIADKTRVEQANLDHRLNHDPGTYMAGEIAIPGMLQCIQCDKMVCLVETTHIEPCHRCDGIYFHRVTSRWPPQSEIESNDKSPED
ncbi:zinc ribbon-containing protein [Hahella ganghwensis]|uniref:zinc ribbon-containing protein n=1 Tax=Hahella ganghwensis TaxID=286420 RepID=UPI0003743E5C|nr:zinc ribbon-containing protein [Hahella ganghwensis]